MFGSPCPFQADWDRVVLPVFDKDAEGRPKGHDGGMGPDIVRLSGHQHPDIGDTAFLFRALTNSDLARVVSPATLLSWQVETRPSTTPLSVVVFLRVTRTPLSTQRSALPATLSFLRQVDCCVYDHTQPAHVFTAFPWGYCMAWPWYTRDNFSLWPWYTRDNLSLFSSHQFSRGGLVVVCHFQSKKCH